MLPPPVEVTESLDALDGVRLIWVGNAFAMLRRGGGGGMVGAFGVEADSPVEEAMEAVSLAYGAAGDGDGAAFVLRAGGGGGAALGVDSADGATSSNSSSSGTDICVRLEPLLVRVSALLKAIGDCRRLAGGGGGFFFGVGTSLASTFCVSIVAAIGSFSGKSGTGSGLPVAGGGGGSGLFKSLADLDAPGLSCLSIPPIGLLDDARMSGSPKPVGSGICSSKSAKETV